MATFEFLSEADELEIIAAIQQAENNTSGEIRVHVEKHSEKPPVERAQEVFNLLGMHATEAKNGVLFYVGVESHSFAIIGDAGIDNVVENDFWDCTRDIVIDKFKERRYKEGLVEGVLRAGERLKSYFPFNDKDQNELPDTISRG